MNAEPHSSNISELAPTRKAFLPSLLEIPEGERDFRAIVKWWEERRGFYNLLIIASVVPGLVLAASGWAGPVYALWGIFAVVTASAMIWGNICYTGGWICEYLQKRFMPRALRFGPSLFVFGCVLSFFAIIIWCGIIGLYLRTMTR